MDGQPLAGRSYTTATSSSAGEIAGFLLADLGARVVDVQGSGTPAQIADLTGDTSAARVVLSPYGERGRFAGGPGHHSAVEAVGGAHMCQYTYAPGPAYLVTPYSSVGQGALAAAAVLASELGGSQPALPVSGVQGLFALQAGFYSFGQESEPNRFNHSPRGQSPTYSTYQTADDWIFIGASTTPFTIKVLQAVGLDDVLADPAFAEGPRAFRNSAIGQQLWDRIAPVIRAHPRDHWLRIFEEIKVPAGPVLTMEEALAHPQIRAAGLAEPGEPIGRLTRLVSVDRTGDATPRATRAVGPLPLSGLRVVELAGYIAGSYPGRLLADLGADVVKIEPPDGDPFRATGYGFAAWNHGKRGLSLNLREPADRARLLKLVAEADVLITNYRPEALVRMSLGRDSLFAVNPALIHCTVSAYGESGPMAHLPGFDPVVQGFAGILKRQGGAGEPVKPQMAATDYLSGMLGAVGVLAALVAQAERGGGYVVRTSLLAAALLFNYSAYENVRAGRPYLIGGHDYKGPHPLNALHQTGDGWLLTVAPDATPAGNLEASRYLERGLANDSTDAAIAGLNRLGVPAVPSIGPWDLTAEPHFIDNGLWIDIEQPELGVLTLPAPVLGPPTDRTPAPGLGEHNQLTEVWRTPQAVPN
ncbi:MAG: CoA transferase [Dehalococcoidia bacterium]